MAIIIFSENWYVASLSSIDKCVWADALTPVFVKNNHLYENRPTLLY